MILDRPFRIRRLLGGAYAETLAGQPAQPLFQDVVGLTVALDEARIKRWTELCLAFGYRFENEKETTVLEGPDLTLRLPPARGGGRGGAAAGGGWGRPPAA